MEDTSWIPYVPDVYWQPAERAKPNVGDLIVKRWENGTVWAGRQGPRPHDFGSAKEWLLLERASAT